jgi:hypothetical protein
VEQVNIKDIAEVQITFNAPLDEHGNPVVIPGAENLFPVTINPGGVGSFAVDFTKRTPFDHDQVMRALSEIDTTTVRLPGHTLVLPGAIRAVEDGDRVTLTYNGQTIETERTIAAVADALARFRYPLYCVDRGDNVDPENQYVGPFTTHDAAHEKLEHDGDVVRRCRQLRPSEIAFDSNTQALECIETFAALVDELDEAACSGNLPDGAWYYIGRRVVSSKYNDGTLPSMRNYDTWVDDHTSVDAYICEGDE